ncbi:MAG: acylphosphatase [bacterium]
MNEVLRIIVRGRVQGVGYRYFAEDAARNHGVAGWVRNLPGGEVEVLARVNSASKPRFLAALRNGPRMARVENLNVKTLQDDGTCPEGDFTIDY